MLLELQKAIFTKLDGDAVLKSKITGIFDHVPQGQPFPYVVIGDDQAEDFDDNRGTGFEVEATIHVWARDHRGRATVKAVLADIYRLLHRQPLTVVGAHHVGSFQEFTDSFREPDGATFHGLTRVLITLEKV